jgi:glycogen operon protein
MERSSTTPDGTIQPGHALGVTLAGFQVDGDIRIMLNIYWEGLDFELPTVPGRRWLKGVDTSQLPPLDIADFGDEAAVVGNTYKVRNVVVLVNRNGETEGGVAVAPHTG